VELDAVDERALVDRAGVRGALAERLPIGLARSSHVLPGDRRERDELDGVDLDLAGPDAVAPALPDARPLPETDRERDVAGQHVVAQLAAELHHRNGSWERRRDGGCGSRTLNRYMQLFTVNPGRVTDGLDA
jgi:hypothetical protein